MGMRVICHSAIVVMLTLMAVVCVDLVKVRPGYTHFLKKLGKSETLSFRSASVASSSLISGSATCRSVVFSVSHDASSASGVWECHGPAKFRYHYGADEAVYILEGVAEIEYLGKTFFLKPGDSTHFAAGSTAIWTVPEHVRKTFLLHDPGRGVKYIRRWLDLVPAHLCCSN